MPSVPTANEKLRSMSILHAHFIERLKTGEVNAVLRFLNPEVYEALAEATRLEMNRTSVQHLHKLWPKSTGRRRFQETIRKITASGFTEAYGKVRESLYEIATVEAGWQEGAIRRAVSPLSLKTLLPPTRAIRSAVISKPFSGDVMRRWFRGLSSNAATLVDRAVTTGVVNGDPIDTIVRRVTGTRTAPGALKQSKRQVQTVVRTAVNHAVTQAREQTFQANAELLKGEQWLSTLDAITSLICADLDGEVFPLDSGQRPPAHPNCRSQMIPVLKSWKELGIDLPQAPPGTRASMNGQVSAKLTYKQWLRDQPVTIQNEVLGPARAKLFRANKIPGNRFTDRTSAPISVGRLQQLSAQHG
jgi:SPP1 gp7 family putative phage head morphogenesis protein